ncbi:unnamed protein product [Rhizophagus irregularis]|jgi:hypothetical protein|uniref:Uncharacterized protein n=1 Tax=Rhizophagus irregularis TaxID=588596 RepID=A0A2I1HBX4_9GLOM|nr:hypothetical protein RhiirA4_411134 [Rhizophagus irregularis]CAB4430406.1 unnamed protein product [Rhizophagus irregularis]CAB4430471.1 unnamed protein product [Rhizophagus irregularis]
MNKKIILILAIIVAFIAFASATPSTWKRDDASRVTKENSIDKRRPEEKGRTGGGPHRLSKRQSCSSQGLVPCAVGCCHPYGCGASGVSCGDGTCCPSGTSCTTTSCA